MNNLPDEFMAECHRQRIREEVEQIRLERLVLRSRPRFLERIMFNFGNWMIFTSKQLRKRYETSDVSRSGWTHSGSTE